MYFCPEIETAFRDEIEKVKLERLSGRFTAFYDHVPCTDAV